MIHRPSFFSLPVLPLTGFLLLLGLASLPAQTLRWGGSDYFSETLAETLGEWAAGEGMNLRFKPEGFLRAEQAWSGGLRDGLLLFTPEEEPDWGDGAEVFTLGYAVPLVVVREGNPLREITAEQLGFIYSVRSGEVLRRWGDLGLEGEWENEPIRPMIATAAEHPAAPLFQNRVLEDPALRANVQELSRDEILARAGEQEILAVLGSLPEDAPLRVLSVQPRGETFAFAPSAENIHVGDYPYRLPLYLVIRTRRQDEQVQLVENLLGDSGARLLEAEGLVPVPPAARLRNQQRWAAVLEDSQ